GQVPHLRRRLTMIVQAKTPRSLSWPGCLMVLGLGLGLLPLVPVQAQPAPPPPPPKKPSTTPPTAVESATKLGLRALAQAGAIELDFGGTTQLRLTGNSLVRVLLGGEQVPLTPTFLDLQPVANVKRTDNFHSGRPGNDLVALPRGVHTLGG